MTSNEVLPQESTAPRKDRAALPGEVVLVMQGGGAPGCYQAGAYHALHEAGIEPDWVIGTSIGAINGAIIAGNEASDRVQKLKEFWQRLDSRLPEPWSQVTPVVAGVPGFYYVNPALALGVDAPVGIERAAMYLVDPLKEWLPTLVDFDRINSGRPRLTLGLTTVQSGEIRYFDSKRDKIALEHVLGSGAIPPSFPAVLIDGEYYWDGGVYSNSPIEASSLRIREEIRSCLRFRSGPGAACCPTRFNMLSCAKRTSCLVVGPGITSSDWPNCIASAASSAN